MKKNKGFSLVELILVLSIIAGITIAAFIIYIKVQDSNYINKESRNIQTIRAGIKSLYINPSPPESDTIQNSMIEANLIPTVMLNKNNSLVSAWGSYVYTGISSDGNGKLVFAIRYTNVNQKICTGLISNNEKLFPIINVSNSNNLTGMTSGGTIIKSKDINLDLKNIVNMCAIPIQTGSKGVDIVFKF